MSDPRSPDGNKHSRHHKQAPYTGSKVSLMPTCLRRRQDEQDFFKINYHSDSHNMISSPKTQLITHQSKSKFIIGTF